LTAKLFAFAAWAVGHADVDVSPERIDEAYKRAFATEAGRIVLFDLYMQKQVMAPSFTPGTSHADAAYLDGIKAVVAEILARALVDFRLDAPSASPDPDFNPGAAHDRNDLDAGNDPFLV
jgi:hypothetical protein